MTDQTHFPRLIPNQNSTTKKGSKKLTITRSQSPKSSSKRDSIFFVREGSRATTKILQPPPQQQENPRIPAIIRGLNEKKPPAFKPDKIDDQIIKGNDVKKLIVPKSWGVKKKFSRSQSPKLKKVDALLIESPFWKNDYEYNFQIVDRTFFDNYYSNESLLKDNEKAKKFNEVEYEKYDVKMNHLIEQIKEAKEGLVLKGTRLEDDFMEYLTKNSNIHINAPKIILNNNHLSSKGALLLLKKVNEVVLYMDLSYNLIFPLACDPLTRMLANPLTRLQYLSLTNCKLKDESAKKIFFSIMLNRSLRVLKLSNNAITDECASHFKMILQHNCPLTEFYLSWNQLTAASGIQIAESLQSNRNLRVLDLSFNKLGSVLGEKSCAESIKELLMEEDSEILHLDLSHTNFSLNEAKIIAEGLENNHKIYGFHFQGNPGKLDSRGYLIFPEPREDKMIHFAATYRHIEGVTSTGNTFHKTDNNFRRRKHDSMEDVIAETSNCWICEGWREHTFDYISSNRMRDRSEKNVTCFIHIDFEDWQPFEMEFVEGKYIFRRMCPPREVFYFFSLGGRQIVSRKDVISKNDEPNLKVKINGEIKDFFLPNLNMITIEANKQFILDDYSISVYQVPRTKVLLPTKHFVSKIDHSVKMTWVKETSLFSACEVDSEDLLNRSLDSDWKNIKFFRENAIPAETMKALRDIIFSVYVYIKDCHKCHSSLDSQKKKYFVLPKETFFKIIQDIKRVVVKFKLSNEELSDLFDQSQSCPNRSWPKDCKYDLIRFPLNLFLYLTKAVNRSEFLELLIRIAKKIYFQEQQISNTFSSFLQDGLFVYLKEFFQQGWREETIWLYPIELAVNTYMRVLKYIFQKYARTAYYKEKYGEYMTHTEFNQIWIDSKLVDEKEFPPIPEIESCFYLSAATQIHDTMSKRHSIINFIEYVEAIARLASKYKVEKNTTAHISIASNSSTCNAVTNNSNIGKTPLVSKRQSGLAESPKSSPKDKHDSTPTHVKFELIIWRMADLIEEKGIIVDRNSIFENINLEEVSGISPKSPRRTIIQTPRPSMRSINFMRSKTSELEQLVPIRPLIRLKSKFNQIIQMGKLPHD